MIIRILKGVEDSTINKRNLAWIVVSATPTVDGLAWLSKKRASEVITEDARSYRRGIISSQVINPPDGLGWVGKKTVLVGPEDFNRKTGWFPSLLTVTIVTDSLPWLTKHAPGVESSEPALKSTFSAALLPTAAVVTDNLGWRVFNQPVEPEVVQIKAKVNVSLFTSVTPVVDTLDWRRVSSTTLLQLGEVASQVSKWSPVLLTPVVIVTDTLGWKTGYKQVDNFTPFQASPLTWKPWLYDYTPPPSTKKKTLLLLYVGR